jgi:hypothetical protein
MFSDTFYFSLNEWTCVNLNIFGVEIIHSAQQSHDAYLLRDRFNSSILIFGHRSGAKRRSVDNSRRVMACASFSTSVRLDVYQPLAGNRRPRPHRRPLLCRRDATPMPSSGTSADRPGTPADVFRSFFLVSSSQGWVDDASVVIMKLTLNVRFRIAPVLAELGNKGNRY